MIRTPGRGGQGLEKFCLYRLVTEFHWFYDSSTALNPLQPAGSGPMVPDSVSSADLDSPLKTEQSHAFLGISSKFG